MSKNADISLLIGAAGGVTPNGESGALIQKQITAQLKDGVTIKINTAQMVKDIQAALTKTTFKLNAKIAGASIGAGEAGANAKNQLGGGKSNDATKKVKDLTRDTIALNNTIGQAYQLSKGFNKYVSTLSTKQVDALKSRIAAVNQELEKAKETGDRLALSKANRNIKNIKYITDDPADLTRNRKTVAAAKLELQKFQADVSKLSADVQRQYAGQISKIQSGFNTAIGTGKTNKLDDARVRLKALKQELADLPSYVKNSQVMETNIDKARVALTNFNATMRGASPDMLSQYNDEISKIRALYTDAMSTGNTASLDEANFKTKELAANMRSVAAEAKNAATQTQNMASAKSGLANFNKYIERVAPKGVAAFSGEIRQIRDLYNEISKSGDAGKLEEVQRRVKNLKSEFVSLGYEGGNAISYMYDKLKTFSVYLVSSTIAMAFVKGMRDAITTVYDMDAALTDLRIVMNSSVGEAQALLQTYNGMAQSLGATTKEVASAAVEWQRQGYDLDETNTLIKDSMILSITGFIDSAEAATALTSAMKGYQLSVDEALGVVDKFVATDQVAATSAGDLAIALSKTAANAKLAGLSLDEVVGQLAVVNEVMQEDPESTGTFYNTMLSRMGMIKSGRLVDPETNESLSDVENTLSSLGIKLRDSSSEFRNFGDILDEVGRNWDSYSSVQQRAIASAFAGTRQQTRFLSLMSNWGTALKYTEVAAGSAGTAVEKFGVYEESLEAKTNKVTAAFEKMSMALIPSGLIGGFLDFSAAALNAGSALGGLPVTIATVTALMVGLRAATDAIGQSTFGASIKSNIASIKTFIPSLGAAGIAATAFAGGEKAAAVQTDALRASLTVLTPAKIANIAATRDLTKEELKAILVKAELDDEIQESVLSQYADITAKKQNAAATTAVTAANVGFKNALKGTWALIAANPLSALITGFAIVLPLIIKIGDALHTSREELRENFEESLRVVGELNNELETTQARIKELEGYDSLSVVEQEELDRLKAYNQYLEDKIYLENQALMSQASEINRGVEKDYNEINDASHILYNDPENPSLTAGNFQTVTGSDYFDEIISRYEAAQNEIYELRKQFVEADDEETQKRISTQIEEVEARAEGYKGAIEAQTNAYSGLVDAMGDVNGSYGEFAWLYEDLTGLVRQGAKALQEGGTKQMAADIEQILSDNKFADIKQKLFALATQGKLTMESFEDPAFEEFVEALAEAGIVSEDSADEFGLLISVIDRLADAAGGADDEISSLEETIGNFGASADKIQKIGNMLNELKENKTGTLNVEFMANLFELLPETAGRITSVKDAQEALTEALARTQEEAQLIYGQMLVANSQWLETTINNSSKLQSALAGYYKTDLSNWQKNAQAKWVVDSKLVSNLSDMWGRYMGVSTEELQAYVDLWANEVARYGTQILGPNEEYYKGAVVILELRKEQQKILAGLKFTPSFDSGKTSSSKKEIEKYTVAIEDFREALKRLKDVQNEIGTAEIKIDLIDEKDVEGQKTAISHLIALYKEEQATLHNLNNERDAKIAEMVQQLNKYGLGAKYDSKSNEFWVQNLEKINQIAAYDKNGKFSQEATNKLRKQLEELVKTATEYADANIDGSEEWWSIQKKIFDLNSQIFDLEQELYEQRMEALEKSYGLMEDLVKLERDRIKQAGEDLIDSLEEEIDAYDEIIKRQKESLQLRERERAYEEEVSDAVDEIAKLQAKADALALDDSRAAQLERGQILEQIAEKQKELDATQRDHSIENAEEALDAELERFEASYQERIDTIRDFLDDQERMTDLAYENIEQGGKEAFDKLLAYCKKYTEISELELTRMWDNAILKIKEYGSLASAMNSMGTIIDMDENGGTSQTDAIIKQMKANSEKWKSASPAERSELQKENQELAERLSEILKVPVVLNGKDGRWHYGNNTGPYVYHTGGIVGSRATHPQKELMILAERGEMVLTTKQQNNIFDMLTKRISPETPQKVIPTALAPTDENSVEKSVVVDASVHVNGGMVDDAVLGTIERQQRKVANILTKVLLK